MLKDTAVGAFYDSQTHELGDSVDFVYVSLGMTPNDLSCSNVQLTADPDSCRGETFEFRGMAQWQALEFEDEVEIEENGFGGKTLLNKITKQIHSFKCVMDERDYSVLKRISSQEETMQLKAINDSGTVTDTDIIESMDVQGEQIYENVYEITFTFEVRSQGNDGFEKMAFGTNGCCVDLYENAPFEDPCDPGSGTGGSGCETYEATVTEDAGTLTASVTGGSGGAIAYQWFYKPPGGVFELLGNNASSLSLGDFGTYKVIATEGNCSDSDSFIYLDPCVQATINKDGNNLTALPAGGTYVWEYHDGTSWSTLADTTQAIVADDEGDYRVTVTDGDCESQAIVTVAAQELCDPLTLGITNTDGVLSVTGLDGAVPDTYDWSRDIGAGYVPYDTGSTTDVDGDGLYKVELDIAGCIYEATLLILEGCNPCDDLAVSISEDGGELTATVTGCDGTANVTWYRDNGSGYVEVGSGVTYTPTESNVLYKVEVVCGECEVEKYYLQCAEIQEEVGAQLGIYKEFKETGTRITVPEAFSEIWIVYRDGVRLIEDKATGGYEVTVDGIELSEPPFTDNPEGGQEYIIIYEL